MSLGQANCAVCGSPIVYYQEAREFTCEFCGKTEAGHCACEDGHYVCDSCHRSNGIELIRKVCMEATEPNPILIMNRAMASQAIYPNGPEHHTLVGAALIAAYCNAGGELDREKALAELEKRSLCVPGGTCGFWGCCGAATSAGQAMSIINGSTPMATDSWAQCQELTSKILGRLAEIGGPRCCKRTGYSAILISADYINQVMGSRMELPEQVRCGHSKRNNECLKERCPYFPGTK